MNAHLAALPVAVIALLAVDLPLPIAVDRVGGDVSHVVQRGETWLRVGARYGIETTELATLNGRLLSSALKPGETLVVDTRHLVPDGVTIGITINIPQRMLFVRREGRLVAAFPVGLGRPDWPTFIGPFTVLVTEADPTWDVPPSIQAEQRRAGQRVITRVGPGSANPLGKYWLGLSAPGYGIHGTNAPASIFRFQSHGCIRLHPDDIAALWPLVSVGMAGAIIYEPLLISATEDDLVLEAHKDIYRRASGDPLARIVRAAEELGVADRIDRDAIRRVLQARDGRVHSVALRAAR